MTKEPIDSLMPLARSWNNAPSLIKLSSGISASYDKYQRSYVLTSSDANSKGFAFTIEASADSPVYNLSLVIHNWNAASVSLFINNKALKEGDGFTVGYVPGLEENYILVFINHKSKLPFSVDIRGR